MTFLPNTSENLRRLMGKGVFEYRVLESGKFNAVWSALDEGGVNWEKLRPKIIRANKTGNVFFTINPLLEDCRSKKQFGPDLIRIGSGDGITDKEVKSRRWFLIDLDPERMKGVSSSDKEKALAWEKSNQIQDFLRENGFFDPVVCDSGNGYHLLYRIAMPNDKDHADLLRDFLAFLDEKFSDNDVKIDKKVFNAARIVKLYGTFARKGRNDVENGRPHRKSGFISFPELAENRVNDESLFVKLLGERESKAETPSLGGSQHESVEYVREFLDKHDIRYREEERHGDFYFYLSDGCVFNELHRGKDACIIINKDGKRIYKCFHDSCSDKHWKDFVKEFEPDYKTFEERRAEEKVDLSTMYGTEVEDDGSGVSGTRISAEEGKVELELDKKGVPVNSVYNFLQVLRHDPKIKNLIGFDTLSCDPVNRSTGELWSEADDARTYAIAQTRYRLNGHKNFELAMAIRFDETKFHPVRDLLDSLKWDGVKRVETSLIDYLGAKDSQYTRFVARMMFVAAVARAYTPGKKYDNMPILVGNQGCGKSTFCERMALRERFFTDSIRGIGSKEALEQLLGAWIVEWGEMSAMKRAKDSETIKLFLGQRRDKGRPAYGRRTIVTPRMCTFIGTSNDMVGLLNDRTGNRRFFPVTVTSGKKSLWGPNVREEFEQMMAEAVVMFKEGVPLTIPSDLSEEVERIQEEFLTADYREGVITAWVASNPSTQYVCIKQLWDEALGLSDRELRRADSLEMGQLLSRLPFLEKVSSVRSFSTYGPQRAWRVKYVPEDAGDEV